MKALNNKKNISNSEDSNWVSLSDMMTGLMVIFLFIAISYMHNQKRKEREHEKLKKDLYSDLNEEFKDVKNYWNMEIDKSLYIRFINSDVLFSTNSSELKEIFKEILFDFYQRLLNILLKEKYKSNIEEIRIEGHTDNTYRPGYGSSFMSNMELSQSRARSVLDYYYTERDYIIFNEEDLEFINYKLTCMGYSYSKTLDSKGKLTFETKNPVDKNKSRRVEFKILLNNKNKD